MHKVHISDDEPREKLYKEYTKKDDKVDKQPSKGK